MKHQKVAVLFVFLVLIVMTGCAPKESWVEVGRMSVPHVAAMVAFFDESHGFTVGGIANEDVFYTLDGGSAWTKSDKTSGYFQGVDILGQDHA